MSFDVKIAPYIARAGPKTFYQLFLSGELRNYKSEEVKRRKKSQNFNATEQFLTKISRVTVDSDISEG